RIKRVHDLRGGRVVHFPKSADHVVRAGAKKSPGKADQSFAGIGAAAGAFASGNGDKVGRERMLKNVARVELVGVAGFAEDDSGIERARDAGGAMSDEVKIGIALRMARQ